jgi:glycosyltransferase involved in cell wall biosynthesis
MNNPRIGCVHIITKLELGGAQDNTLYSLKTLPPEKYNKILITGAGGIRDDEAKVSREYAAYFISPLRREINPLLDLISLWRIFRLLRRLRPHIVHTHSSKAGIVGRWAAYFARVPVIIHTFHGFGFNDFQNPVKRWALITVERMTALITGSLIFVSRDNMNRAKSIRIGKTDRYTLIHSGIHRTNFPQNINAVRHEMGVREKDTVVFSISCLKPQKNVLDFARLAKRIRDRNSQCSVIFFVAGDGEERPIIERYVKENKLEDIFIMLGWRTDAVNILAASDIFVMTSLWEGLPRALLEAMAVGKPACVYAADGAKDVIEDGVNGYITPIYDVESLADRVERLVRSKALREEIGARAKNGMKQEYFIDTMVKTLDSHYTSFFTG